MSNWLTKIIFKNNSRPAINDTNLNLLQNYIENAIERAYTSAISIIEAGGDEEEISNIIDSLKSAIADYNSNANIKIGEFNEVVAEKVNEVINEIEDNKESLIENLLQSEGLKQKLEGYEQKHNIYRKEVTEAISANDEITLDFSYKSGMLEVLYCGERLIKNEEYEEIFEEGQEVSNKIKILFDVPLSEEFPRYFDFVVKGVITDD